MRYRFEDFCSSELVVNDLFICTSEGDKPGFQILPNEALKDFEKLSLIFRYHYQMLVRTSVGLGLLTKIEYVTRKELERLTARSDIFFKRHKVHFELLFLRTYVEHLAKLHFQRLQDQDIYISLAEYTGLNCYCLYFYWKNNNEFYMEFTKS